MPRPQLPKDAAKVQHIPDIKAELSSESYFIALIPYFTYTSVIVIHYPCRITCYCSPLPFILIIVNIVNYLDCSITL